MKKTKRLVSFLLAAVLIAGLIPSAFAVSIDNFTDISGYMPTYEHFMRYVVEQREFMVGINSNGTTFSPNVNLTRADMMVVLCKVFGVNLLNYNGSHPFTDVPSGSYYEKAVAWGYNYSIISGTSATTFNPSGIADRQTLSFVFDKFCIEFNITLPNNGQQTTFTDDSSIYSGFKAAVYKLYRADILTPTNGYIYPTSAMSRVYFTAFLFNYCVPPAKRFRLCSINQNHCIISTKS